MASSISRRSATIRSRVGSARARKISSSSVMTWDIKLSLYPVNGAPPPFFPPLAATKCPERDELGQDRKKRTLHAIWRVCSSKRDWQVAGSNASYPHAGRSVPSRGVFPHEEEIGRASCRERVCQYV